MFKTLLRHLKNKGTANIEFMETDWHTLDWNRQIEVKHSKGYKIVDLRGKALHSMSYSRLVQTIAEQISSGTPNNTIPDAIVAPGGGDTSVSYDYQTNPLGDSHGGGSGIGESIVFLMDNKTGVFP